MNVHEPMPEGADERVLVRWLPSVLLDLSPVEPIGALRTPHRVSLQALPCSREALASLLTRAPFELVLEIENETAPLASAPVHEVHEARLAPDLPLDWPQYYWLADGLLEDLTSHLLDPAHGLLRGRQRLLVAETALRDMPRSLVCETADLEAAWECRPTLPAPDLGRHGEPSQAFQQYVRGLTGHLVEHASSRPFVEKAGELLRLAERHNDLSLPAFPASETRMLALYAQHRLFGSRWLTSPAGMVAGWHLLVSAHVLSVWWTALLLQSKRERRLRDALLTSLWMLDQGLWSDEPLVHDVLRHLNASEYTAPELAAALVTALRRSHVRA